MKTVADAIVKNNVNHIYFGAHGNRISTRAQWCACLSRKLGKMRTFETDPAGLNELPTNIDPVSERVIVAVDSGPLLVPPTALEIKVDEPNQCSVFTHYQTLNTLYAKDKPA